MRSTPSGAGLAPVLRRSVAPGMARGGDHGSTKSQERQEAAVSEQEPVLWAILAAPGQIWLLAALRPAVLRRPGRRGGANSTRSSGSLSPVWNPLQWSANFTLAWQDLVGDGVIHRPVTLRTVIYTAIASFICLVIAYPVAYFVTRFAGRRKTLFLVLLIAPFWVSYMMRMLAWIDLLSDRGYVNRVLDDPAHHVPPGGLARRRGGDRDPRPRLRIHPVPDNRALRRARPHRRALLEAARDLGLGRVRTFFRVTLPLSQPDDPGRHVHNGAADGGGLLHQSAAVGSAEHDHDRQRHRRAARATQVNRAKAPLSRSCCSCCS